VSFKVILRWGLNYETRCLDVKVMLKKRWIRVLLVLFCIWITITAYFFNQHRITIKRHVIDKKIVLNDDIIKFDEIVFKQFEENYTMFAEWRYKVVKILPRFLQMPFLKASFYYSKPYKEIKYNKNNQFGILELRGTIITNNKDDYFNENISKKVSLIDDNGRDYSSSCGALYTESNIIFFYMSGKYFDQKNINIKAIIKDENNDIISSFPINLKWQNETYNFFNKKPVRYFYLDPQNTVKDFVKRKTNNKKFNELICSHVQSFPWENINHEYWINRISFKSTNYIGKYKGFLDVYLSELEFFKDKDIVANQNIYLIDTGKTYKIIDICPIKIVK